MLRLKLIHGLVKGAVVSIFTYHHLVTTYVSWCAIRAWKVFYFFMQVNIEYLKITWRESDWLPCIYDNLISYGRSVYCYICKFQSRNCLKLVEYFLTKKILYIDDKVQDCSILSALMMEIQHSCAKPWYPIKFATLSGSLNLCITFSVTSRKLVSESLEDTHSTKTQFCCALFCCGYVVIIGFMGIIYP